MCFSAPASFIAGTAHSVIGGAAHRKTRAKSVIPFAMIPFLFGIRQLTEGVVWLTFSYRKREYSRVKRFFGRDIGTPPVTSINGG